MHAIANPLPVTFGPHEADWWMVVVTAVGAIASLIVAISALVASRRAEAMAEASERERLGTESRREQVDYSRRLDEAIARLFQAIGNYFGPLREWRRQAEVVEVRNITDEYGDLAYPDDPAMDAIDAEVETVRLVARGDDVEVATALANAIALTHNFSGLRLWNQLKGIMQVTREWRSGAISRERALVWFRKFEEVNSSSEAE